MRTTSETDASNTRRWIVVVVVVQVVAMTSMALLDIYGRQVRISFFVALQVLVPICFTLDVACNWSKTPAFRDLASLFNGLYGLMFTLGIITGVIAFVRETSWFTAVHLTLMLTITATYFVNVVLLLRLKGTVIALGEDERKRQEVEH